MFTLGKSLFLDRSGCREGEQCDQSLEPGSNGLALVRRERKHFFPCLCRSWRTVWTAVLLAVANFAAACCGLRNVDDAREGERREKGSMCILA